MPKKTLCKGSGNGSATDQVEPPPTHRSGMVIRSSAMYLSPCNELFCRKYLMLLAAASRLQSDTSSSLECSSLPCRCLPCIVPCCCLLFGACLRALRGPSPCDFMLQLAKLPRHAGAIYSERCKLQLIRIKSSRESEIILTRCKHDDDCDKFQIELAAQQVPLNGCLCPQKGACPYLWPVQCLPTSKSFKLCKCIDISHALHQLMETRNTLKNN